MWRKPEQKNRRMTRTHVLDVKLRSDQVRATRLRLIMVSLLVISGTFLGIYLLWRTGEFGLDTFVYTNPDFAIQQVQVHTDGIIAPEQLRRWSGVKPGQNLIRLDLAGVKRNLEMVSAIDTVSVERVLPNTLKIRVTERVPVAQVNVARADGAEGIAISVYQLDAGGMVMQPLDPRICTVPLAQMTSKLPVITGMNPYLLQTSHRVELPLVQAALQLVTAFNESSMAGMADLKYVDVSTPGVLTVTTGQGSEITFAPAELDRQMQRWWQIFDYGRRAQRSIASANLAVANNVPVHWTMAAVTPAVQPKSVKPLKNRRKNV